MLNTCYLCMTSIAQAHIYNKPENSSTDRQDNALHCRVLARLELLRCCFFASYRIINDMKMNIQPIE